MTPAALAPPVMETLAGIGSVDDIPILYEDEDEGEMGEAIEHVGTDEILHVCLQAHLDECHPGLEAHSNLNLYYKLDGPAHPRTGSLPYVSPDGMVVRPFAPLTRVGRSYYIGEDGPAPLLVAEILSQRSYQQRDLSEKLIIYAKLGVPEYLLIDITGDYLPERLLLKRLGPDGQYQDERDSDGGVTSQLGFRVIVDVDGEFRLLHAMSGRRYIRPREAEAVEKARLIVEERRQEAERAVREAQDQARQIIEENRRLADVIRLAEIQMRAEAEARRLADAQAQAEAEARRLAEERNQELQAEIERLRQQQTQRKDA